jgi:hypothetical protein
MAEFIVTIAALARFVAELNVERETTGHRVSLLDDNARNGKRRCDRARCDRLADCDAVGLRFQA